MNIVIKSAALCGLLAAGFLAGCATLDTSAPGEQLAAVDPGVDTNGVPQPILGNQGRYMCPFTEDKTVAPWIEKAMTAKAAGALGSSVGAFAGQQVMNQVASQIPFAGLFGNIIGEKLGAAAGTQIGISAAGGWEYIKANTDLSFNSMGDMAEYLLKTDVTHPQFIQVMAATVAIYPALKGELVARGFNAL